MDKLQFLIEDVIDEIFDMCKPQAPLGITFEDLSGSSQGDIIVTMLIDAKGFYDYDQREASNQMMPEDDYGQGGGGGGGYKSGGGYNEV